MSQYLTCSMIKAFTDERTPSYLKILNRIEFFLKDQPEELPEQIAETCYGIIIFCRWVRYMVALTNQSFGPFFDKLMDAKPIGNAKTWAGFLYHSWEVLKQSIYFVPKIEAIKRT